MIRDYTIEVHALKNTAGMRKKINKYKGLREED